METETIARAPEEVIDEAENLGKALPVGLGAVLSAVSGGVVLGAVVGMLVGVLVGVLIGRSTAPRPSRFRLRS